MIDPKSALVLYAECEVYYSGRADSSLERGQYLIIHKSDGTLLIHSSTKNPPCNYQGPGAKLEYNGNSLISRRKSETITIIIHNILSYTPLLNWSDNSVSITKTEKDLVQKLFDNWYDYFDVELELIYTEYQSNLGPIDFLGIDTNNVYHIVEAKRTTAVLNHCSQLQRYLESFQGHKIKTIGYIASPKISNNAMAYLQKHGCYWIKIDF